MAKKQDDISGLRQAAKALRKRARKLVWEVKDKAGALAENIKILAEHPDNPDLRKIIQSKITELELMLAGPNVVPLSSRAKKPR